MTRFTAKMNDLLQIEREAEMEETANILAQFSFRELEKRNLAITKLFIRHVATGVYGRILLHLVRGTKKGGTLPPSSSSQVDGGRDHDSEAVNKLRVFSPGDIVGLH